ncbi:MAG: hypothetical protein ACE5GI_07290 [Candidatus Aminicenantales bacterium]
MKRLSLIILILLLSTTLIIAKESKESNSTEFLGKTINFILLFGALAYLLFQPLKNFLQKRTEDVEKALQEAEDSKQKTAQKLEDIKKRLANLKEEVASIEKEGEVEGKRTKEKIIKEAQLEAARIKNLAQEEIKMLTLAGLRELREYTAELATAIALERIKEKLTPQAQSKIFDKSLKNIEKLYERKSTN